MFNSVPRPFIGACLTYVSASLKMCSVYRALVNG